MRKQRTHQQTEGLIIMAHTYKTDPDWVKEARVEAGHPSQFARYGSAYAAHRRDLSRRIRARERREMDRIMRDIEAWEGYVPMGNSEFDTAHAWVGY